jgi:hypothetical protein
VLCVLHMSCVPSASSLATQTFMDFVCKINWACRKDHSSSHSNVFVTVDGTDFRINEPTPFSPTWYSHKFKGPGVRYEVGVCIATGWIVWLNGPYRCGTWNDLKIASDGLHYILEDDERYIADGGYCTPQALHPHDAFTHEETAYMQICRTRHETINRLFKNFSIVGNTFTRSVEKHGLFLYAIANIVQVGIMFKEIRPFAISEFMDEPASWPESW